MSNDLTDLRHEKNAFGDLVVVIGRTQGKKCMDCMHWSNKIQGCSGLYYNAKHLDPTMCACRFFKQKELEKCAKK